MTPSEATSAALHVAALFFGISIVIAVLVALHDLVERQVQRGNSVVEDNHR